MAFSNLSVNSLGGMTGFSNPIVDPLGRGWDSVTLL